MSIVLNEYEWAERMIASKSFGKDKYETIARVARYYKKNQYSKDEIRRLLEKFILQCDPNASIFKWSDTIDRAVKSVDRYELIDIAGINITDKEMERIAGLDGIMLKRLAFTLLCIAKYWDAVSEANRHWVNTKDNDIMAMANISKSVEEQSSLFSRLRDCGLIQFSKKVSNTNTQVKFMEDGDVVLVVTDFRNLGYQYMKFCGGSFFECENCGITVKRNNAQTGRPQKYCRSCAAEVRIRQTVESVMRHRREYCS